MRFDLHVHTTFSDGDYSPSEVVQIAKQKRIGLIAITDHDECRGYDDVKEETGICILPGIELAARFEGEAHILGLGIDWHSEALLRHIERVAVLRRERAGGIIKKLRKAGLDITIKDVESECRGGVIGRPHIAAALVKKGRSSSVKEAFKTYLSKHTEFYVPFDKISVEEAAKLIGKAGGKAVLAHPGFIGEAARNKLMPLLGDMGFWGIEAYHPSHSKGQCTEFESLARSMGLYVTAGSDFHGSAKPAITLGCETRGSEYLKSGVRSLMADSDVKDYL
jgi:hypothetical protein